MWFWTTCQDYKVCNTLSEYYIMQNFSLFVESLWQQFCNSQQSGQGYKDIRVNDNCFGMFLNVLFKFRVSICNKFSTFENNKSTKISWVPE